MLTNEQKAGVQATIKSKPNTTRRWRESIMVAALDAIDFEQTRVNELEAKLANCIPRDRLPVLPEGWKVPFKAGTMWGYFIKDETGGIVIGDLLEEEAHFLADLLNAVYGSKDGGS